MVSRKVNIISALVGFAIVAIFTIGLSMSISSGFAGFKGGLPFALIVGFVLILAFYDIYDTCIRKNKNEPGHSVANKAVTGKAVTGKSATGNSALDKSE